MLLLGLGADVLGKRTFLPRVTLLILCGIVVGESALGLIPDAVVGSFELVANLALMMIGFLLGGKLTLETLRIWGRQLVWISLSAALVTSLCVTLALLAIAVSPPVAILLGCIAAATAPAATVDTVLEFARDNRFSRLLLAVVAIDDVWALVLFSLGLSATSMLLGNSIDLASVWHALREIFGAVVLGFAIGLPAAKLTGRIRPGQPMLTEAAGLVLLCGGAAIWLEVSFLIATISMGAVIANFAKHHDYPFHEIENIEWPFMAVFFILAGATLEIRMLASIGLVGLIYVLARSGGKLLGASLGARVSRADATVRRWLGMALLPQAGVAIGMALIASNEFPEYRDTILPVAIATTVFFELVGPVLTRYALSRAR